MNIVIAGAGAVGIHLAKWLSGESHDITLIDSNQERLTNIDSSIDAITIDVHQHLQKVQHRFVTRFV